tara:strand:+ start:890 stop:1060 length:171 start_codon:yes stop_codon:yes gene_type:complete
VSTAGDELIEADLLALREKVHEAQPDGAGQCPGKALVGEEVDHMHDCEMVQLALFL